MGNPYYIPRQGLVEKLASVANTAGQMQNLRLRPKQLKLEQAGLDETIRSNKASEAYRQGDLELRAGAAQAEALKNRLNIAKMPAHQKPFGQGRLMQLKYKVETKLGKGALKDVFDWFEGASKTQATRGEVFQMSLRNWPSLKNKWIGGLKSHIDKQLKSDPAYLDSDEGKEKLAAIDKIHADKDGTMSLPHFFKDSVVSMMREREMHEAEMAKAQPEKFGPMYQGPDGHMYANNLATNEPKHLSAPSKNMVIESDGKGGFTFSQGTGAGGGFTRGTQGAVEKKENDALAGLSRLKQIENAFDPRYLKLGTRWSSLLSAGKEKLGMNVSVADKKQLREYSAFKRKAISNLNQYIKEITGAQMSEKEAERLMKGMPNPGQGMFDGDSPTEFKAKMDDVMSELRMAAARLNYVRKHGFEMSKVELSNMPALIKTRANAIGAELEAMGLPEKERVGEIRKRLSEEFGLIE
jgi:hypothetical protein